MYLLRGERHIIARESLTYPLVDCKVGQFNRVNHWVTTMNSKVILRFDGIAQADKARTQ